MPMPSTPVIVQSDLFRDVRTEFRNAYIDTWKGVDDQLGSVMRLGGPSTKLTEYYGYTESPLHADRWDRGEGIPSGGFKTKAFNVTNYRYGRRITWDRMDRDDDLLQGILPTARATGSRFALVPERAFFEIETGTASLLPAIPNAPDGVALYSATDGDSADRFGISGGNIITGDGVASTQAILTNFFEVLSRFLGMTDTEGQPLWGEDVIRNGVTVVYGTALLKAMGEAFAQIRQFQSVASATSPYSPAAAAVSNIVKDMSWKVSLYATPRKTDNDWSVWLNNPVTPAVFEQVRDPLEEKPFLSQDNNSDSVRDTELEGVQFRARLGYGVGPAYSAVKVNN